MSSAKDHYTRAEDLLATVEGARGQVREARATGDHDLVQAIIEAIPRYLSEAQVHATLALVAATEPDIGGRSEG